MTDLDSPSSALCRRHAPELLKVMARLAETARDPELRVFLRRELEAQLLRLKQLANDPTLSAELRQEYQIIRPNSLIPRPAQRYRRGRRDAVIGGSAPAKSSAAATMRRSRARRKREICRAQDPKKMWFKFGSAMAHRDPADFWSIPEL